MSFRPLLLVVTVIAAACGGPLLRLRRSRRPMCRSSRATCCSATRTRPGRAQPRRQAARFLAPVDGVLNVWVGPDDEPDAAKPVTNDKQARHPQYFWAYTSKHILYLQDKGGDENWHVYTRRPRRRGEIKDLTPLDKVAARRSRRSATKFPDEILVGSTTATRSFTTSTASTSCTGEAQAGAEERRASPGFVTDDDYKRALRAASSRPTAAPTC